MKRVAVALFTVALALGAMPPSHASIGGHRDAAEWDGGNYLDVVKINHGHGDTRNALEHSITMHEPWQDIDLEDGDSYILVNLDTDADRRGDAGVVIDYDAEQRGLYAYLYGRGIEDQVIGVSRPNLRTVSIAFNKKLLPELGSYRWKVRTWASSESDDDCGEPLHGPALDSYSVCSDLAPNRGRVAHDL